jgi:alpha-beta hydrolase superfamily lysophospholipase
VYVPLSLELLSTFESDYRTHFIHTPVTTIVLLGENLLKSEYQTLDMPMLITHGEKDTQTWYCFSSQSLFHDTGGANQCTRRNVLSPIASKKLVDQAPSKDKKHVTFPGCLHELHNELEEDRKKVIQLYVDWILSHAVKAK